MLAVWSLALVWVAAATAASTQTKTVAAAPATLPETASLISAPSPMPVAQAQRGGMSLTQYFQKRMETKTLGQVHQRHSLLTPRELVQDFMSWDKDSNYTSGSKKSGNAVQPADNPTTPAFPKYEMPTPVVTTEAAPTPPAKPLSNAIYSASLDAMTINKNIRPSSSNTMLSRRRMTGAPSTFGPDANRWTPVTRSGRKTYRSRASLRQPASKQFSFEGGGGGLDLKHMEQKPSYVSADSFRDRNPFSPPKLEVFEMSDVRGDDSSMRTSSRPYQNLRKNPRSRFRNDKREPYEDLEIIRLTSTEFASIEPIVNGPPAQSPHLTQGFGRQGSPGKEWSDGVVIDSNSPIFKQQGSPEFTFNQQKKTAFKAGSPEIDHSRPPYFGQRKNEGHENTKKEDKLKEISKYKTHVSPYEESFERVNLFNSPYSKENNPPQSRENPKYFEFPVHNSKEKSREVDFGKPYRPESQEKGPYTYKSTSRSRSRENSRYRITSTEIPVYIPGQIVVENKISNEKNSYYGRVHPYSNENDPSKDVPELRTYQPKPGGDFRYTEPGTQSKEHLPHNRPPIQWSKEKMTGLYFTPSSERGSSEPEWRTEGSPERFPAVPALEKNHLHSSSRGKKEMSMEHPSSNLQGFEGFYMDDHFPNPNKSPEMNAPTNKKTAGTMSRERKQRPNMRFESKELNKPHKMSRERPSHNKPRSRPRPRPKTRGNRQRPQSSREPSSSKSREKMPKRNKKIIDDLSVHHIAGPPYHDSIPLDVVKTLRDENSPGYVDKKAAAASKEKVDSYEEAVDKFLGGDEFFTFDHHDTAKDKSVEQDPHLTYHEHGAMEKPVVEKPRKNMEGGPHRNKHFGQAYNDDSPSLNAGPSSEHSMPSSEHSMPSSKLQNIHDTGVGLYQYDDHDSQYRPNHRYQEDKISSDHKTNHQFGSGKDFVGSPEYPGGVHHYDTIQDKPNNDYNTHTQFGLGKDFDESVEYPDRVKQYDVILNEPKDVYSTNNHFDSENHFGSLDYTDKANHEFEPVFNKRDDVYTKSTQFGAGNDFGSTEYHDRGHHKFDPIHDKPNHLHNVHNKNTQFGAGHDFGSMEYPDSINHKFDPVHDKPNHVHDVHNKNTHFDGGKHFGSFEYPGRLNHKFDHSHDKPKNVFTTHNQFGLGKDFGPTEYFDGKGHFANPQKDEGIYRDHSAIHSPKPVKQFEGQYDSIDYGGYNAHKKPSIDDSWFTPDHEFSQERHADFGSVDVDNVYRQKPVFEHEHGSRYDAPYERPRPARRWQHGRETDRDHFRPFGNRQHRKLSEHPNPMTHHDYNESLNNNNNNHNYHSSFQLNNRRNHRSRPNSRRRVMARERPATNNWNFQDLLTLRFPSE